MGAEGMKVNRLLLISFNMPLFVTDILNVLPALGVYFLLVLLAEIRITAWENTSVV